MLMAFAADGRKMSLPDADMTTGACGPHTGGHIVREPQLAPGWTYGSPAPLIRFSHGLRADFSCATLAKFIGRSQHPVHRDLRVGWEISELL